MSRKQKIPSKINTSANEMCYWCCLLTVDIKVGIKIHQRLEVPGGVVGLEYFDGHISCFRLCLPLCWGFLSIMWMIMEMMAYFTLWESFMLSESSHWVSWSCPCLHCARWEWGTEVLCCLGNMSYFFAAPYGWSLNCPNLKTLRTPKLDINLYFYSQPFWRIWLKGNRFQLRQNWV